MANSYMRNWGGTNPGCLIILLDQSDSMNDMFGQPLNGAVSRKCDALADVTNAFLNELISVNTVMLPGDQTDVRPRAEIALYGYSRNSVVAAWGGSLAGRDFVSLPELLHHPLIVEDRLKKVPDGAGNFIEMRVPFPVWVNARTDGGTPMLKAFHKARDTARDWAVDHQSCYPPVIVNITDGMASDSTKEGDLEAVAQEITNISTEDGHALLFTIHVTELKSYPVEYPASEDEVPRDPFAKRLFALSSVIPDTARAALGSLLGRTVPPGAKGFVFNGDAEAVLLMFRFASAPAIQVVDPNR